MSADNWLTVAIAGFSTAGLATITAVVLFFALHIRAVQGELSGKTAAREMKAMRENNERLTERKNRYEREYEDSRWESEETETIREQEANRQGTEGTTLLRGNAARRAQGTTLLRGNAARKAQGTTLLRGIAAKRAEGTALPDRNAAATLLAQNTAPGTKETPLPGDVGRTPAGSKGTKILSPGGVRQERPDFTITRRIIEIHTEERIAGS